MCFLWVALFWCLGFITCFVTAGAAMHSTGRRNLQNSFRSSKAFHVGRFWIIVELFVFYLLMYLETLIKFDINIYYLNLIVLASTYIKVNKTPPKAFTLCLHCCPEWLQRGIIECVCWCSLQRLAERVAADLYPTARSTRTVGFSNRSLRDHLLLSPQA